MGNEIKTESPWYYNYPDKFCEHPGDYTPLTGDHINWHLHMAHLLLKQVVCLLIDLNKKR